MTLKTRSWAGMTLLLVLVLNYAIFGYPLIKNRIAIKNKADAIFIRQAGSGDIFRQSDEDYVLEVFRKEARELDRKIRNLNGIALTSAVIILSWTAFGLMVRPKGKR